MGKVQKSVRFENEAVDGVIRVSEPGENFTTAVNRVLLVGIQFLENESQFVTQTYPDVSQSNYSESQAERYIKRLEEDNARLIAEHEKDREAIAEKDKLIADTLSKTQELTAQSNHIALIAQELKRIPATTTGEEITVVMTGEEVTEEPTTEPVDEEPVKDEPAEPAQVEAVEPEQRGFLATLKRLFD